MLKIFKEGILNMFNNIKKGNIKKEIANLLTISRLFAPFIIIPLIAYNKNMAFIIMIIIFSLTDTFDGYFARKYNAVTLFGGCLDAFVDKIYIGSLLFPIVLFPWIESNLLIYIWIFILFELFISITNIYAFNNKLKPKTLYLGKVKTTVMFITMGVIYLKRFIVFSSNILLIFLLILLILEMFTFICYLCKIKKTKKS